MISFQALQFPAPTPPEERAPDGTTLYAIGDLHGRADLLELLIDKIKSDRMGAHDRAELIFLGDYIDRGPDSVAVIDRILELQHDPAFSVTTLKGNHESTALQFLADPAVGQLWCRMGGRQTLLSYGVCPPVASSDMEHWEAVRKAFQAALPERHLDFLRQLAVYAERGSYIFVHAGLRPGVKLAEQREWDMLWIRGEFLNCQSAFEKIVVHGHTSGSEPFVGTNRIGIDTGADVTNRLTGLKLVGSERELISVCGAPVRAFRATGRAKRQGASSPFARVAGAPMAKSPERNADLASTPPQPAKSLPAWFSAAVPAGLVALAAIGYLAMPPTSREVVIGSPEIGSSRLSEGQVADQDINDLIERADKALRAAGGSSPPQGGDAPQPVSVSDRQPVALAAASVPAATGQALERGGSASSVAPSSSRELASVAALPSPGARVPGSPTAAAALLPPSGTTSQAGTASQSAARSKSAPAVAKPSEASVAQGVESRSQALPSGRRAANVATRPIELSSLPSSVAAIGAAVAPIDVPVPVVRSPIPIDRAIADGAVMRKDAGVSRGSAATRPAMGSEFGGDAASTAPMRYGSIDQPTAYANAVPVGRTNRIGPDDYPEASIRAGEQGVVGVRYVVGIDGRVSACTATSSSNFARLDKRTCDLIYRRFRFKPAVRNGEAAEDVREQRIRWTLCRSRSETSPAARYDKSSDVPCEA
jgi:serine/threonine protein phosphatase 1